MTLQSKIMSIVLVLLMAVFNTTWSGETVVPQVSEVEAALETEQEGGQEGEQESEQEKEQQSRQELEQETKQGETPKLMPIETAGTVRDAGIPPVVKATVTSQAPSSLKKTEETQRTESTPEPSEKQTAPVPQTYIVQEAVMETSVQLAPEKVTEESVLGKEEMETALIPAEPAIMTEPEPPRHEHRYVGSTVQPTCESGGYTVYTCSCGDSYTGDETASLGHEWAVSIERICIGQEGHTICGDCGADLTTCGITGDAVAYHMKEHVLAGGTGRSYSEQIPLYAEHETRTCIRCGAVQ